MHPAEALVQAGNQVFPASPVAIGPFPHVVAGLGGNEQLVPVGTPVCIHMAAEIGFRGAGGRAVVVGQVKVRDSVVKGGAEHGLLDGKRRLVPEVVPQAEGQQGQHDPAVSAAAVLHGLITVLIRNVHWKSSFCRAASLYSILNIIRSLGCAPVSGSITRSSTSSI